ncbi:MAG: UbiA family prenyltransferase [archaeon]|nr:MAG: UbiA family prenyltransferase [archaeon]
MERFFYNLMKKHGRKLAVLELVRPWNAIVPGLLGIFGYSLGGGKEPFEIILIFFLFILAYMAGTTINDLYDELIDRINMPYRPLQEGRIRKRMAFNLSIILHGITLFLGFLLGWKIFLMTIIVLIFSFAYSVPPIAFSRRGIISQIELSITMIFIPLLSGVILSLDSFLIPVNILFLLISLTSVFIFVFLTKDFKDIAGDSTYRKKTTVSQLGKKNTKIVALTGSFISFALVLYFFYEIFTFNLIQIIFLILVLAGILYQEFNVERDPEKTFGLARLFSLIMLLILMVTSMGFF